MNVLNILANFIGNAIIFGVIGLGVAVNHDNSAKAGFLVGVALSFIYTIWAIFNGFLAPIL